MTPAPGLAALLVAWRADLLAFVERHAQGLLRYESAEDIVQGIHVRALERGESFEYQGEKQFLAWMHQLARSYLVDRRAHWAALKRGSRRLLRITAHVTETRDPRAAAEPAATDTGASTIASRREQADLAVKALALLLPRDRDLVRWHAEGVTLHEQAARLGQSYDTTQRVALRAMERFRKSFKALSQPR